MADIKTNQDKLYKAAIDAGLKLGNEEQFASRLQNSANRKKLYNALISSGLKLGDYDSFEKRIYDGGASSKQTAPQQTTPTAPTQPQPIRRPEGFGAFDINQTNQENLASMRGENIWAQPQTSGGTLSRVSRGEFTPEETQRVKKRMQQRQDEIEYEQETGKRLRQPVLNTQFEAPTVVRNEYGTMLRGDDGQPIIGNTTDEDAVNEHQQIVANQAEWDSLSEKEKRERANEIQLKTELLDYEEPGFLGVTKKKLGSGFIKAGLGLLNGMQALTSGMIVEDASSPTGYSKTSEYNPADDRSAVNRGLTTANEYAERMSREGEPRKGAGFVDLLMDGDIGGFLLKGWGTGLESAPMTLSAYNPYTMTLNAISMAGNNFRDYTLEDPDVPTWKRASMAIGSAAIEQAVEKYADPVFKYIGGGRILGRAGKEASEEIAREVTREAENAIAKRIMDVLKDAAGEGIEEVVTNFGNDALGEALDLLNGEKDYGIRAQWEELKSRNPNASLSDFAYQKAKENLDSFFGGALAGAYMSGTAQATVAGLQYAVGHTVSGEQITSSPNTPVHPATLDVAQSFDEGYIMDGEKDKAAATGRYIESRSQMMEAVGEETLNKIDANPTEALSNIDKLGLDEEGQRMLNEYVGAKATYDGIMERMKDEHSRSRVNGYNVRGNVIEEIDSDGNVVGTHEYKTNEDMKLGLFELQQTRANNDMLADMKLMQARRDGQWEQMVNDYCAMMEISPEAFDGILNTDPMKRTESEQQMVQAFAQSLHDTLYDNTELHENQNAEDGSDVADAMAIDLKDPDATQAEQVTAAWNAAKAAREELFAREEDLKQEVEEREKQGMPHQGIISSLDSFRPQDVQVVIDYYNAQAKFNSFMNRMGQKIEEETANLRQQHAFKGTINGQADLSNVYTISDGTNEYFLVSGNVTTDADGKITGSDSGLVIGLDENGDFVQLSDTSGYSVMPSVQSLDQFEEQERIRLQEQVSLVIDPNGAMVEQENGGTLQTAASQPHGSAANEGQEMREDGQSLIQSPSDGSAAALSALSQDSPSAGKGTNISEDSQGNTTDNRIGRSLTEPEANDLIVSMEANAAVAPDVELTIENWDALFGEDGKVETPIGQVKMGEHQFAKMMRKGRDSKLGMIKPTLENPDVIIEDKSNAVTGDTAERQSSYIFVKSFKKADGSRYYYFTSITVSKDGKEVVVSNQEKNRNKILRLLQEGGVVWRTPKDATATSAERQGLDYEQPNEAEIAAKGSGITPQTTSSADKGTENVSTAQENQQKILEVTDKDGVKRYENGIDIDAAIADIQADGLDVNETADLAIAEAQEALGKIKAPKTRAEQVKGAKKRAELQNTIDYYTELKDRFNRDNGVNSEETVNVEPVEPQIEEKPVPSQSSPTVEDLKQERIKALKAELGELFDDDFTKANDVYELVSMWVGRKRNLAWDDVNGKRGLQKELGWTRKIGGDTRFIETLLAKKGEGMGVDEFVHTVWESPENDVNGEKRFDTQEIKDALLDLLKSATSKSDVVDYAVNTREAQVRAALAEQQRLAEEAAVEEDTADVEPMTSEQIADMEANLPFAQSTDEDIADAPVTLLMKEIEALNQIEGMPEIRLLDTDHMSDDEWYDIASGLYGGAFVGQEEIDNVRSNALEIGVVYNENTGEIVVFSDGQTAEDVRNKINYLYEEITRSDTVQEEGRDDGRDSVVAGVEQATPQGEVAEATAAEGAADAAGEGRAEPAVDPYLQPRNEEESQAIADVERKLNEEIAAAEDAVRKAKSTLEKAQARESERATDMFSDDEAFETEDQLFSFDEMGGTDRSQEGVERRTSAERAALQDAENTLERLQSQAEHDSRVRGALDDLRRQTSFDADPMAAIERNAEAFRREQEIKNKETSSDLESGYSEDLDAVNEHFNQQLDKFENGQIKSHETFSLGEPSAILKHCGINAKELRITQSVLAEHRKKHNLTIEDLRNLPNALQNPIMVYEWGSKAKSYIIITSITTADGRKITVSVRVDGKDTSSDVRQITSVHGKDVARIIKEMNTDKTDFERDNLRWVDKEKALDWLSMASPLDASTTRQELDFAAKIIQETEKSKDSTDFNTSEGYSEDAEETPAAEQRPSEYKQRIRQRIDELAERLGTADRTTVVDSLEDIEDEERRAYIEKAHREGRKVYGWFDSKTGQVSLFLPDIDSEYKAEQTVWHETVAHVGLRELLGAENYGKLLNRLWLEHKDKEMGSWVTERMANNGWSLHKAIDEWLAREAEKVVAERQERRTLWQKLAGWVGDVLREIGYRTSPTVTDVRYLFWLSENQLRDGEPMSAIKRAAFLHRLEQELSNTDIRPLLEKSASDMESGFSEDIDTPLDYSAKDLYEQRVNTVNYVFSEAYQDGMIGLKIGQESIANQPILDSQDAYTAENRMHGIIKNEGDKFNVKYRNPLIETINKVMSVTGMNWGDIDRYVYTKHGLERNRGLYVRDWLEKERKKEGADLDRINDIETRWNEKRKQLFDELKAGRINFADYLNGLTDFIKNNINDKYNPSKRDYSGFRSMFGDENGKYDEAAVIADLMNTEDQMEAKNVDELWERINAATRYGLEKYREAGMRSDEQIDHIEQMFNWYVPLRGFKEETGEDVYQYFSNRSYDNEIVDQLREAKGRGSEANFPIATIFAMSYNTIAECERNKVKQKLYRLCQANPNDLVVLSDSWAAYDNTTGEFVVAYPDIKEDMTDEQIRQAMLEFEDRMNDLAKDGLAKKINGKAKFDYRPANKANEREHIVEVRINGNIKRMTVVGNPRMAQALNGKLTFRREDNIVSKWNAQIKNFMSATFTSYSPTFVGRNMARDFGHLNMMLLTKEGKAYTAAADKYYGESFFKMKGLFEKYREGTLDESIEMERDFKDFMDNGGITGFSQMSKVDDIQKEMEKLYKQQKKGEPVELNSSMIGRLFEGIEALNEAIENNARFATYRASRHYAGRTKARSATDAKEITVNFNRKGAGRRTAGFKSKAKVKVMGINTGLKVETLATIFGWTSQVLNEGVIFFNAAVQGIATVFKNFRNADGSWNGKYIMGWTAKYASIPFAIGIAMPIINKMLASWYGYDDDDDPYANLPDWTRRNNWCILTPWGFVTIPISPEQAAFCALGDMIAGNTYSPELKPLDRNEFSDFIGIMNTFVPVEMDTKVTKGGLLEDPINEIAGRTFSILAPLVAIGENIGWTERPIYKEDVFNNDKYKPEYQMVYSNVNPILVGVSEKLNEWSGGDDVKRGWAQVNPAILQYALEQYTGGAGKFIANIGSMAVDGVKAAIGEETEDFNIRKVDFVRAFFQQPDDRTQYYRTNAKFRKYKEDAEEIKSWYDDYNSDAAVNPYHYLKAREMERDNLVDLVRANAIKEAEKELKKKRQEVSLSEGGERKKKQKEYNEAVKKVVDYLDNVPNMLRQQGIPVEEE